MQMKEQFRHGQSRSSAGQLGNANCTRDPARPSRSFVRPGVCCTRGQQEFSGTKIDRSGLLDIIDSNSSLTRAELQVQKSEGRHQKITQENKLNRVSSLPHSVVLFLYAQGRTSLLTSVSIMCTGSHLVYVHKVVLIVRTQARVNLLTELSL